MEHEVVSLSLSLLRVSCLLAIELQRPILLVCVNRPRRGECDAELQARSSAPPLLMILRRRQSDPRTLFHLSVVASLPINLPPLPSGLRCDEIWQRAAESCSPSANASA